MQVACLMLHCHTHQSVVLPHPPTTVQYLPFSNLSSRDTIYQMACDGRHPRVGIFALITNEKGEVLVGQRLSTLGKGSISTPQSPHLSTPPLHTLTVPKLTPRIFAVKVNGGFRADTSSRARTSLHALKGKRLKRLDLTSGG